MSDDLHIRRDQSALAEGALFGRRRRSVARWKIALFFAALVFLGLVLWQADNLRPRLLAILGTGATATPNAEEYFRRGDLAFARGDLDTAIDNYRQAANQIPYNVDILYELSRMLLYRSYDDARDAADIAEAQEWAAQALETNPGNARAHTINCFALLRAEKSEDAVRACRQSIELKSNDSEPHAYLSMAYLDLGRIDEAAQEGKQAVTLNERSIDANTAYAQALASQNKFDAALDYYQRATLINPRLEFPYFNLGYTAYSIAITKGDTSKYQVATTAYNTVLSINSRNAKAYTRLCWTYMASGEWNLARDNCVTATDIDGSYSPAWRWLGEVRYRTMDYAGAITAFQKCAELESSLTFDRRQPECWVLRGLAYYQASHDCDQAMPIFSEVLSWAHDARTIRLANEGIGLCGKS